MLMRGASAIRRRRTANPPNILSNTRNGAGYTPPFRLIMVSEARKRGMAEGMSRPEGVLQASALVERAAEVLSVAVEQIRAAPVQGGLAPLYVQGVILELMARLLGLMAEGGAAANPSAGRMPIAGPADGHKAAAAARAILMDDLTSPPSIAALAQRVGLSQRRLNEVFQQAFGASPAQCLQNWRLDQARRLLGQGDMTVKQVAHRMGYAHVSSFSHAYARRFGHSPSHHSPSQQGGGGAWPAPMEAE